LGNIGSKSKIEYAAIGDIVNMAARLQGTTKKFLDYPIIMSKEAWNELDGHPYYPALTNLGMQKIRGKKKKLEAFGFNPLKDHPLSMAQGDKGFLPLQRMRGV
jgi:class 3 adenylate cyclase